MKTTLLVLSLCLSQCLSFAPRPKRSFWSNDAISLQASTSTTSSTQNELVVDLLQTARSVGQVGSLACQQDQDLLLAMAQKLKDTAGGISDPAFQSLAGVFDLVYSAAPGGSSGRLVGPLYGKVQQTFLSEKEFINSVQFGPLQIALLATCEPKSPTVTNVKFKETTISLFGQDVVQKQVGGGGAWKYLWMGEVEDTDGKRKLIRVMETPSLFILEQPLE